MSDTRAIILVHTTLSNRNGGDPAIDLDAPGIGAALSEYQRTRSDDARARIPLRKGMRPAEFIITRLSQHALRFARSGRTPAESAQFAVLAGCHTFVDASGVEHRARVTSDGGAPPIASDEWLAEIGDEYGGAAVDEIGHAIIQWSMAPRRALDPFGSVPGLMLAR